jgi:hypothetical protein
LYRVRRVIFGAVVAILAVLLSPQPARIAAGESLPYDDYRRLVARIEPAAQSGEPLAPLAGELAAVTSVGLPDGTSAWVDNSNLVNLMKDASTQADHERVATRARALLAELQGASPEPTTQPDPAADLDARNDILNDPDLQRPAAPPQAPELPEVPNVDLSFMRYVLVALGGVAIIAMIALLGPPLVRYLIGWNRRRTRASPRGHDEDVATSAEAIERAEAASSAQDYRRALRLMYLAALLKLDEIGALRYDRAQTNREYVRQVALQPALSTALQPVVEMFDDAWYGFYAVTPESYSLFESRVHSLLDTANAESRATKDQAQP